MATNQRRHICHYCGVKTVESKMTFEIFWFHLKCKIDSQILGTDPNGCPKLSSDFEKCPYFLKVLESYSTPFWIEMRIMCPLTFIEMMCQRHNLSPSI